MPSVKVREEDSFDGAMRKLKRSVDKARTTQEFRSRERHVSASVKKQRKKAAAIKRLAKRLSRDKASFRELGKSNLHSGERKKNKSRSHKEDKAKEW